LARSNATHCFIGGPKRRKQPERYVQWGLKWLEYIDKKLKVKYKKIMEKSNENIIFSWFGFECFSGNLAFFCTGNVSMA
jgi:hypothetical protein